MSALKPSHQSRNDLFVTPAKNTNKSPVRFANNESDFDSSSDDNPYTMRTNTQRRSSPDSLQMNKIKESTINFGEKNEVRKRKMFKCKTAAMTLDLDNPNLIKARRINLFAPKSTLSIPSENGRNPSDDYKLTIEPSPLKPPVTIQYRNQTLSKPPLPCSKTTTAFD